MTALGTVHEGIAIEDYFAIEAESSSRLKEMRISPLNYQRRCEIGIPDRDVLRLGRLTHSLILEPGTLLTRYALWTEGRRAGKKWEAFAAESEAANKTVITTAQLEAAERMRASALGHPIAGPLLREKGRPELTITWVHERTGLLCRARIDWLCSVLLDVKTCRNPSPELFGSQAARLGHHMQMAFYAAALASVGLQLPVKLLAIQNDEPFDCVVYGVPDEVLIIGEQLYETALDRVADCRRTGIWPGLAWDEEQVLRLPAWAITNALEDGDGSSEWGVSVTSEVA